MGQVASGWQVVIVCPPGCCFLRSCPLCACVCGCHGVLCVWPSVPWNWLAAYLSFHLNISSVRQPSQQTSGQTMLSFGRGKLMSGHGDRKDKHTRLWELAFYGAVSALACRGRKTFGSGESVRHVDVKSTCTGNPEMTSHLATAILQSN